MSSQVHFTSEEVGEIVALASEVDRHADTEDLSWDQVAELAMELGISADALATALLLWRDDHAREADARHAEIRRRARFGRRLRRLRSHTVTYLIVVSGLVLLDWMSGSGWWVQWIAIPWGILLARQSVRLGMSRSVTAR